jgi:hypothetical protein
VRRALYWTAVLVALGALVSGAIIAYAGYSATAGPDGAVKGYFAALARSDAPAALAFGGLPAGPRDMLTSQVLAEQEQLAPLRDVQIGKVSRHGANATVGYSYRLGFATGAKTVRGQVRLHDTGAGWRLSQVATVVTVQLGQAVDRSTFAQTSVPPGRTLLFPGALPIRLDTAYLTLEPSHPQVRLGAGGSIRLSVRPSASARTQLTEAVQHRMSTCVSAPPPTANCPLPSPRYVPGSLRGQLVGDVSHEIHFSVSSEAAGSIEVQGAVTFRGTYRRLTYDNVPETRHGRLKLQVHAAAYAVRPLKMRFGSPP